MRPTDADFRAALRGHGERIERYRQSKMTGEEFRPVRLSYGLYYELDHTSHMQRIKLPGGVLTAEQIDVLADIADEYARGVIHVTTRQCVQMHWIDLAHVLEIYERLHAVGITTRGACSDSVRNVTGCVHGGIWPGEPFDVTPYVMAVHEYFLFHPLNLTLPRKFKIAFSGCTDDCAEAPVNDIAYFPHIRGGKPGFAVHAGGGLGSQPFLARPIRDFIPAENTLIMAEAIVRLQHRSGERKNRKKARMKYLFQRMGRGASWPRWIGSTRRSRSSRARPCAPSWDEIVASYRTSPPLNRPSLVPDGRQPRVCALGAHQHFRPETRGILRRHRAVAAGRHHHEAVSRRRGSCAPVRLRRAARHQRSEPDGAVDSRRPAGRILPPSVRDRTGSARRAAHHRRGLLPRSGLLQLGGKSLDGRGGGDSPAPVVDERSGRRAGRLPHHASAAARTPAGSTTSATSGSPASRSKVRTGRHHPHYSMLVGGRVGEHGATTGRRITGRFPEEEVPGVIGALAEFYRQGRHKGERFGDFVVRVGTDRLSEVAGAAASMIQ